MQEKTLECSIKPMGKCRKESYNVASRACANAKKDPIERSTMRAQGEIFGEFVCGIRLRRIRLRNSPSEFVFGGEFVFRAHFVFVEFVFGIRLRGGCFFGGQFVFEEFVFAIRLWNSSSSAGGKVIPAQRAQFNIIQYNLEK